MLQNQAKTLSSNVHERGYLKLKHVHVLPSNVHARVHLKSYRNVIKQCTRVYLLTEIYMCVHQIMYIHARVYFSK